MAKPKKATVDVELKSSPNPPGFTWQIDSSLKKGKKLEFKNAKHPGFEVYFDLDDNGTGFLFPDDPDLALAVRPFTGASAPCPKAGETWDQFVPVSVTEDNSRLTVLNFNKTPTEFSYTLFVTKDPHGKTPACEAIDPIGSNQNGPRSSNSVAMVAIAVGVVAITVGLAYVFNFFERS